VPPLPHYYQQHHQPLDAIPVASGAQVAPSGRAAALSAPPLLTSARVAALLPHHVDRDAANNGALPTPPSQPADDDHDGDGDHDDNDSASLSTSSTSSTWQTADVRGLLLYCRRQ
jgi:hypothetical protein